MVPHTRKWLVAVVVALAVPAAAASEAQAAGAVQTVRSKGLFATATYEQQTSGCSQTLASNTGFAERAIGTGPGGQQWLNVSMNISTSDWCGDTPVFHDYYCWSDSGSVTVSSNLGSAAIGAELTCIDYNSGEVCQVSKAETLQGIGEIVGSSYRSVEHSPSFTITSTFNGRSRPATVTSASITGCGVALTEQDAYDARIGKSNSGSIVVTRN